MAAGIQGLSATGLEARRNSSLQRLGAGVEARFESGRNCGLESWIHSCWKLKDGRDGLWRGGAMKLGSWVLELWGLARTRPEELESYKKRSDGAAGECGLAFPFSVVVKAGGVFCNICVIALCVLAVGFDTDSEVKFGLGHVNMH
ncbi:unnamed protein product [Prunus armeniaca]